MSDLVVSTVSFAGSPVIFEHTREAWLNRLVEIFRPYFARLGYKLPAKIYISVGHPHRSLGPRAIGSCSPQVRSDDGCPHIHIDPVLSDAIRVGGTVMHELCHAALDCEGGHGSEFKKLAYACGLVGKPTETIEGPLFIAMMEHVLDQIGPFPHASLRPGKGRRKKQSTRLLLVKCLDCNYTLRGTKVWLTVAVPACPNPHCGAFGEAMHVQWKTKPYDTNPAAGADGFASPDDFKPDAEA